MRDDMILYTTIFACNARDEVSSSIRRPVIDNKEFEIGMGLS